MLNEAMRKKTREKDPKSAPGGPFRRSPSTRRNKANAYLIVIAAVVTVVVGGMAAIDYFYVQAPPSATVQPPRPAPVIPKPPVVAQPQAATETIVTAEATAPTADLDHQDTSEPSKSLTADSDRARPTPPPATAATAVTLPPKSVPKQNVRRKAPETRTPQVADSLTAALFFKKGLSYHRQGRYEDAIRMYEDAVSKDPGNIGMQVNLAAACIAVSDFSRAIAVLDTASVLAPDNHQLLMNRAIAEIGLGQMDSALAHIDSAEKYADVPRFDIHFHRSVALSRLGRVEEALAEYRKAEALQSNDARLIFNMALAYDRLADFPTAVRYYQRFLELGGAVHSETAAVQARVRSLDAFVSGETK